MRFVHAIMAHAQPEQLARLIDTLLAPASDDRVVLHIDAGSDLWRHGRERFATHPSGRLRLVERPARVKWGQSSQVEAQRRLLRTALAEPFDYYHLISGADWPACSRERMIAELASFGGSPPVLVDLWDEYLPRRMDDWWFDQPKLRLGEWQWLNENAARAQLRLSWAATRWLRKAGIARPWFDDQPWLKGSSWYSVPWDVALGLKQEMSALLDSGRLAFTQCSDEHVAPTILGRRHAARIKPARRYIDWSYGGSHPKVLRAEDRAALEASGAWFARKVDASVDDFFYDIGPF